ncbi:MAG TPA: phosphatidylinositol-specific phospholipase C domain-containing protein [Polyangiaceae bacterium]
MRTAALFCLIGGLAGAAACSGSSSGAKTAVDAKDSGPSTNPVPTVCNGHAELCDRSYTAVAFPGCHDSYATTVDQYTAADQDRTIAQQLQDGIRVFHLEMLDYNGLPNVCHALCAIGHVLLSDELVTIKAFADAHPNEVITLLTESNGVATDEIAAAFDLAQLTPLLHVQAAGTPWPTLGQMIQGGDRIVVLHADMTKTGGPSYPWLHDRFARTWETPWNNTTPQDFARCDADRGTKGNDIYVVDTYREDTPIATIDQARTVNPNPFLIDRLLTCKKTESTLPNFVMVNFYDVGDLFTDVDILNGFTPEPNDDLSKFPPADWPNPDGGAPDDAGTPVDSGADGG